jgi:hypothetical protein
MYLKSKDTNPIYERVKFHRRKSLRQILWSQLNAGSQNKTATPQITIN